MYSFSANLAMACVLCAMERLYLKAVVLTRCDKEERLNWEALQQAKYTSRCHRIRDKTKSVEFDNGSSVIVRRTDNLIQLRGCRFDIVAFSDRIQFTQDYSEMRNALDKVGTFW